LNVEDAMPEDNETEEQSSDFASDLGWFAAGVVAGMVAAILLAPQSGRDTRQFVSDKAQQGRQAVSGASRDVFERGKDIIEQGRQLVQDAVELFERGRKLVRG
jgi:gas vesicle protein